MGPMLVTSLLLFAPAQSGDESTTIDYPSFELFPPNGSVLPTNARLVAFGEVDGVTFSLSRGRVRVAELEVTEVLTAPPVGPAFVMPLPALSPGEALGLSGSSPGLNQSFSFQVGEGDDVEAPAFGGGDVFFSTTGIGGNAFFGSNAIRVAACLPRLQVSEPVMLAISSDELDGPIVVSPGVGCRSPDDLDVTFVVDSAKPRDACFEIEAIDVAGHRSAPLTVCLPLVDESRGCAQTSATAPAALALVLLGLRRRRQPGLASAARGR